MVAALPPFPVDDFTLDQVEHAIGVSYGDPSGDTLVGGEFTLTTLLDFLSGYDPARLVDTGEAGEFAGTTAPISEYPDPVYSQGDVIGALIREVRYLRGVLTSARARASERSLTGLFDDEGPQPVEGETE